MEKGLEAIVQEKPSIKKRIGGFIRKKTLPWMLLGALAVGAYAWKHAPNEPKFHRYGSIEISEPIRLTHTFRAVSPTFSPDGKKIAYVETVDSNGNGEWDTDTDEDYLSVVDIKTKKSKRIKEGYSSPIWGSDNKIYFVNYFSEQEYCTAKINPDGTDLECLTNTENAIGVTTINPKGDKLLGTTATKEYGPLYSNIWIMDTDGKNLKQIGKGDLPSFSPEGTKIAFERTEDTDKSDHMNNADISQIFEYDFKTEKEKQLTFEGSNDNPRFLPDERIIYEHADVKDGKAEFMKEKIYIMNSDGSNPRRLTKEKYDNFGEALGLMSPNGNYVLFLAADNFYLINMNTESIKRTGLGTTSFTPIFSPDSKSIAYVKRHGPAGANIYLMKIKE